MRYILPASQLSGTAADAVSIAPQNSLEISFAVSSPESVSQLNSPILVTSNTTKQQVDAPRSVHQICVSLKQRLTQVPGFHQFIEQLDEVDLINSLRNLFREGYPLLTIYNSLHPSKELRVQDYTATEAEKSEIAIFQFIQACREELNVPPSDRFVIADLVGNDTSRFVKVVHVINYYILDLAEKRGYLIRRQQHVEEKRPGTCTGSQITPRDHIVKELVDTERKYFEALEHLYDLKKTLENMATIPSEMIDQIFLNIDAIIHFQRRFLTQIEVTNKMPTPKQQWGSPFVMYEDEFDVYQKFVSNSRDAARIIKNELIKHAENEEMKQNLIAGHDAAERVLHRLNEVMDRDLLEEVFKDLLNRMNDWKNYKVEQFGKLILHGTYAIITTKVDKQKEVSLKLLGIGSQH
ncbi:hypothetical protein G7Z17_g319 [Cylindrodendrum hubeiense]|uniref:DH domain-containing protein n=1 Tax=Cylindrodendrum hubeiense TaxID=595255 RepID=A0A9P5HNT6_9HYPO|nr:hypothetical protein G7Z17_g319 [Cylindrodendrum hubeiense]